MKTNSILSTNDNTVNKNAVPYFVNEATRITIGMVTAKKDQNLKQFQNYAREAEALSETINLSDFAALSKKINDFAKDNQWPTGDEIDELEDLFQELRGVLIMAINHPQNKDSQFIKLEL